MALVFALHCHVWVSLPTRELSLCKGEGSEDRSLIYKVVERTERVSSEYSGEFLGVPLRVRAP